MTTSYANGTLTVRDTAGHVAHIKFAGGYALSNFQLSDDGAGGTLVKDPLRASPANIALFGNYIAAGFPAPPATPCPALLSAQKRPLSSRRPHHT